MVESFSPLTPERATVGWIGTGVMGTSMCRHLIDARLPGDGDHADTEQGGDLIAAGAAWADSPARVAAASDVVFTMVGYPRDVREVDAWRRRGPGRGRAGRRSSST